MREETIRSVSTGDLIRRLSQNVSGIVDREVNLAKEEARADVRQIGVSASLLVVGGLSLFTALVALVVAAVLAIAPTLMPVTVALVVTAIFAALGAILALIGWSRVKVQPLEKTRESLKEDVEWAKSQTISREK